MNSHSPKFQWFNRTQKQSNSIEEKEQSSRNYLLHVLLIDRHLDYKSQFEQTRAIYVNGHLIRKSRSDLMHALVYKSYDLNEYTKYDEDLLYRPYLEKQKDNHILKLIEMQRSATQNQLNSSSASNSSPLPNQNSAEWPNKSWMNTSSRLSSLTFYQMLHSSLSNLSINAFNYKLELGKSELCYFIVQRCISYACMCL